MASSLNSPEHPAEKSPDTNICGTGGIFLSRLTELCPLCMRSLYQTCDWRV